MNKKLVQELKQKLEQEKKILKEELQKFAKEDKELEHDWDTLFPKFNSSNLEEAADEVEEYVTLLPIEHSLEIRLKNINLALDKIKNKKYGKCEKCEEDISEQRLKICPEAKICVRCLKRIKRKK